MMHGKGRGGCEMSIRCIAAGVTMVAVVALASVAEAQKTTATAPPRTPWGQPDLQGIWDFRSITPLQRPEELANNEFLTQSEAAKLEREAVERNRSLDEQPAERTTIGGDVGAYNNFWMDRGTTTVGTRRTSLIVDPPNGRIPPLTRTADKRAAARNSYRRDHPADSWEDRSLADRCLFTTGLPILPAAYNNNVQLFQTPDHVVIIAEMTHTVRIFPLNEHHDRSIPQWVGNSRAHWEGDTLVVETTNFHDQAGIRGSTSNARLVERFKRVSPATLQYEFTVEDPETWTRPWTAQVQMTKSEEPLYEYACHEGNYAMVGILAGARAEEKAAEAKKRD
jgi:hypothetical protein